MLGLGLGSTQGARFKPAADAQEQPPAFLPANFFIDYSVTGGDLTFTANQSVDSTNNWLKIQYPNAAQTNISGVLNRNAVPAIDALTGVTYRLQFDIHLLRGADWTEGVGNNTVTVKTVFGSDTHTQEVAPDTSVTFDTGTRVIQRDFANDNFIYFDVTNDLPEANAVFYIKNYSLSLNV